MLLLHCSIHCRERSSSVELTAQEVGELWKEGVEYGMLLGQNNRYHICKRTHRPAQTGSSHGCTKEAYLKLVQKVHSIISGVKDKQWLHMWFFDTISFARAVGFDMTYMFAYNMRGKIHVHGYYIHDVPDNIKRKMVTKLITAYRESIGTSMILMLGRSSFSWSRKPT